MPGGLAATVQVIEIPRHSRNTLARNIRNVGRLTRRVPPLVDRFSGFGEQLASLIRNKHYELAVIEHFWCAPYWEQISPISDATLLDLHNVESVLHERCARVETGTKAIAHRAFGNICRAWEEEWLPRFTYLLAASPEDSRQLQTISPDSNVLIYANAIPLVPMPDRQEEDVVVFSGNLEYYPNISGVRYFREEIWPGLKQRWPGLVWRLIGKNPRGVAKIVENEDGIEVSGPVADAIPELARAKVAIVPLLAGSGTRIKILEAWAAGVPVVSTPLGAEGLPARDGEHLLLAKDARAFQEAVSALLANPDLRKRIGRAGRYLFECEFTWETAWRTLDFLDPCYHGKFDALRD